MDLLLYFRFFSVNNGIYQHEKSWLSDFCRIFSQRTNMRRQTIYCNHEDDRRRRTSVVAFYQLSKQASYYFIYISWLLHGNQSAGCRWLRPLASRQPASVVSRPAVPNSGQYIRWPVSVDCWAQRKCMGTSNPFFCGSSDTWWHQIPSQSIYVGLEVACWCAMSVFFLLQFMLFNIFILY
jgi:hypothetical protein